jgi:hypothetical protein
MKIWLVSVSQKYELHEIINYWDNKSIRELGLEYVGGPEWDYETPDMKYVGTISSENHERDSTNDRIYVYKKT